MSLLLDRFREIWAVDFEFIEPDGERPTPVCMVAWEMRSGRKIHLWQDELPSTPPYSIKPDALFVSFSAAAEFSCHLVLDWPQPAAILDLYVEYRWLTNGVVPPGFVNILSVQDAYGIEGISITEKAAARDRILRGGPWSAEDRK